jgi:hypothetical protein
MKPTQAYPQVAILARFRAGGKIVRVSKFERAKRPLADVKMFDNAPAGLERRINIRLHVLEDQVIPHEGFPRGKRQQ